jgi:multicomponent Na+:H+ antiporter subunit E
MLVTALLAIPMAVIWMIVTSSITPGSFGVGLVLGFAILLMMKVEHKQFNLRRIPDQLAGLGIYTVTLMRDIWLSSVDVAKRVLDPNMPLNPGIIAVQTQDADESDFTAAFSAHGITITPGELVVDFDGNRAMYVHCLDTEASAKNAAPAQAKRLKLLRRIMGKD